MDTDLTIMIYLGLVVVLAGEQWDHHLMAALEAEEAPADKWDHHLMAALEAEEALQLDPAPLDPVPPAAVVLEEELEAAASAAAVVEEVMDPNKINIVIQ